MDVYGEKHPESMSLFARQEHGDMSWEHNRSLSNDSRRLVVQNGSVISSRSLTRSTGSSVEEVRVGGGLGSAGYQQGAKASTM